MEVVVTVGKSEVEVTVGEVEVIVGEGGRSACGEDGERIVG